MENFSTLWNFINLNFYLGQCFIFLFFFLIGTDQYALVCHVFVFDHISGKISEASVKLVKANKTANDGTWSVSKPKSAPSKDRSRKCKEIGWSYGYSFQWFQGAFQGHYIRKLLILDKNIESMTIFRGIWGTDSESDVFDSLARV